MKKILKFFIYMIVFLLAILIFLPKEQFYNLAQKELVKQKVIISDEKVVETINSLVLNDSNLYYDGINVAKIKEFSFKSLFISTDIEINNIVLLESLQQMFPSRVNFIRLKYNLLNYDKIDINAKGEFGIVNGFIDLINRKIEINLRASSKMKNSYSSILRQMKQKNGGYIYEYRF